LNDLVVHREGLTRYLHIEVKSGGEALMNFAGDGVIVATPTGSTAYSLSAGGPFVYPTLNSFVVTPLCAHALLVRPIVLPAEKSIGISIRAEDRQEKAAVTVDGQEKVHVASGDLIEISKARLPFRLIGSSKRSYLETLREKFGMVSVAAKK
jgi:NAD+ kinase